VKPKPADVSVELLSLTPTNAGGHVGTCRSTYADGTNKEPLVQSERF
jgi:hypothetical protein